MTRAEQKHILVYIPMTTLVIGSHQSQQCHSHRSYSRDEKRVADRDSDTWTRGYRPITVRDTNVRDTHLPPGWSNCIMEKQTCLIQRMRGLIKLHSHEKGWRDEFVWIFIPTESSIKLFTFAVIRIKQNRLPSDGDRNDFEVWWLHLGARGVE